MSIQESEKLSVTDCINNLSLTDKRHGVLKGRLRVWEHRLKVKKSQLKRASSEKSDTAKETHALSDPEYERMVKEYNDEAIDFFILDTKRETWITTIEVWRSQNANRRQGNV